jgi:HK97 family phage prohead protease
MPLPKPKDGEKNKDFLDRCMANETMNEEYPDEKQRYAVCNSLWDEEGERAMENRTSLKVNRKGVTKANGLIKAGKINTSKGWSFDSKDRHKLLNSVNENWSEYAKWFLVVDGDAEEDTFQRYRYPFGKNGEIWRRAVIAIKQRASQQNFTELAETADRLLKAIDKKEGKSLFGTREYRYIPAQELRTEQEGTIIKGYAAVFNKWSEDLGGFREIIRPGAFTKTLKDGADVRALQNHESNYVLGRTKSQTLLLEEDDKGLAVEIHPPDTQYARDLIINIDRGDVDQMSFGFETIKDRWGREEGRNTRELLEVKLFDVSIVTYPAYPQTVVQVRELFDEIGLDYEGLRDIFLRFNRGIPLFENDRDLIKGSIDILNQFLLAEPCKDSHSDSADPAEPRVLTLLEKHQELVETTL